MNINDIRLSRTLQHAMERSEEDEITIYVLIYTITDTANAVLSPSSDLDDIFDLRNGTLTVIASDEDLETLMGPFRNAQNVQHGRLFAVSDHTFAAVDMGPIGGGA
jgi:hypothetical protein